MFDVVALGELLVDFACISTDADGYPTMVAHPGGAPANYLATVNKYGGKTALIGKVGNDTFGKLLTGTLEKSGIDTRGIVTSDEVFTTLAFVTFDTAGNRKFAFSRKPGADTLLCMEEIDFSMIDEAKVFHFGTLSLTEEPAAGATRKAVEYAKAKGKLISFDPNLRKPLWKDLNHARQQILWGMTMADIIKISDDEVEFLFNLPPEQGMIHILESFDAKLVFITCGAEGCIYANRNTQGFIPALKEMKAVDTTGAGDIFGGSAMSRILALGKAPDEMTSAELKNIVLFATIAAGMSTTQPGGISSIPELVEVLKRMD